MRHNYVLYIILHKYVLYSILYIWLSLSVCNTKETIFHDFIKFLKLMIQIFKNISKIIFSESLENDRIIIVPKNSLQMGINVSHQRVMKIRRRFFQNDLVFLGTRHQTSMVFGSFCDFFFGSVVKYLIFVCSLNTRMETQEFRESSCSTFPHTNDEYFR